MFTNATIFEFNPPEFFSGDGLNSPLKLFLNSDNGGGNGLLLLLFSNSGLLLFSSLKVSNLSNGLCPMMLKCRNVPISPKLSALLVLFYLYFNCFY